MTEITRLFIEPLDVLSLRGNKLFGDPGSYGECLLPPWPSAAAGAVRSALLVHKGIPPEEFAEGTVEDPELGTPARPGPFLVAGFTLARRHTDGRVESLHRPPADLVTRGDTRKDREALTMHPHVLHSRILSSAATARHAVLSERERKKAGAGYWLTQEGWRAYLEAGEIDPAAHLVRDEELWALDTRVGVGLDATRRAAAEGRLFTVQTVAMRKRHHSEKHRWDVGFVVEVQGAQLPERFLLRFGGDGHSAIATRVPEADPQPDLCERIARDGRCRLILTTPGIFQGGWLPPGAAESLQDGSIPFHLHGVQGRLVCAVVPRFQVVSGWDLAKRQPKPALRAAPTGSVYWLELDEGVTPQALRKLAERGLWTDADYDSNPRRAEGFNRIALGLWRSEEDR